MKVLHVIPSVAAVRGGPSEAVLEITKALNKRGIQAEIATTNDNGDGLLDVPLGVRTIYKDVPVWFFSRFSPPFRPLREYVFSTQLTGWLWKNITKYQLIHVHALFSYVTTAVMIISRLKNIPYIIRPNGMLCEWSLRQRVLQKNVYLALFERENIEKSRMIEFTSIQEKKEASSLGFKPDSFILPYALHRPSSIPEARKLLREFLKVPQDEPVILFISRLHLKKGLDPLIPALGKIKDSRFVFVVAGSGSRDYEVKINNLLSASDIHSRTHCVGFVQGRTKELFLQGADIFVLPSYSESFGLAVLEAMACRLPVVITDRVGIYTDVKEYGAGIVTRCDAGEAAWAIGKLLNDENLRKSMGENGKRLAEERFTWDKVADKLVGVYREIVKE
ncbi:MAG: glycosyltransferase [Candidatus Omnitrophota bacterium]